MSFYYCINLFQANYLANYLSSNYIFSLFVVIFSEALLLKVFLRQFRFRRNLLFSTVANICSIGVNYFIAKWLVSHLSSLAFFGVLFFATLLVELFVLVYLYEGKLSCKRGVLVSFSLNIISYLLVYLLAALAAFGFQEVSNSMLQQRKYQWSYQEVLGYNQGNIYSIENNNNHSKYYLKSYDVAGNTWNVYRQYSINPLVWDIEAGVFAGMTAEDEQQGQLSLFKVPEWGLIKKMPIDEIAYIKLSPDAKKMAILKLARSLKYQVGDGVHWKVNGYNLIIYDIASGKKVYTHPDLIFNQGLDWSPDSESILFVSSNNKSIFFNNGFSTDDIKSKIPQLHARYIYKLNIKNKAVELVTRGSYPQWSPQGDKILLIEGLRKLYVYDLDKNKKNMIISWELPLRAPYKWSPNGKSIIGFFAVMPMIKTKSLAVFNRERPSLRYLIDNNGGYNFDWEL